MVSAAGRRATLRALGLVLMTVEHMRSRTGVWFATHEQVARYVENRKPAEKIR
jgi:hypothetical protein